MSPLFTGISKGFGFSKIPLSTGDDANPYWITTSTTMGLNQDAAIDPTDNSLFFAAERYVGKINSDGTFDWVYRSSDTAVRFSGIAVLPPTAENEQVVVGGIYDAYPYEGAVASFSKTGTLRIGSNRLAISGSFNNQLYKLSSAGDNVCFAGTHDQQTTLRVGTLSGATLNQLGTSYPFYTDSTADHQPGPGTGFEALPDGSERAVIYLKKDAFQAYLTVQTAGGYRWFQRTNFLTQAGGLGVSIREASSKVYWGMSVGNSSSSRIVVIQTNLLNSTVNYTKYIDLPYTTTYGWYVKVKYDNNSGRLFVVASAASGTGSKPLYVMELDPADLSMVWCQSYTQSNPDRTGDTDGFGYLSQISIQQKDGDAASIMFSVQDQGWGSNRQVFFSVPADGSVTPGTYGRYTVADESLVAVTTSSYSLVSAGTVNNKTANAYSSSSAGDTYSSQTLSSTTTLLT